MASGLCRASVRQSTWETHAAFLQVKSLAELDSAEGKGRRGGRAAKGAKAAAAAAAAAEEDTADSDSGERRHVPGTLLFRSAPPKCSGPSGLRTGRTVMIHSDTLHRRQGPAQKALRKLCM